jgi:hypothetical protein
VTRQRHLAAVPAAVEVEAPDCLLCGAEVPVLELDGELEALELCPACNSAFHVLARQLEAAQESRARRAATVASVLEGHVPGQLELED